MAGSFQIPGAPIAHDPEAGAAALAGLGVVPDGFRTLLGNAASASPYLAGLIAKEAAWVQDVAAAPADAVFAEILAELDAPFDADSAAARLRRLKGWAALWIALADLGGTWTLDQVTGGLSRFADAVLDASVRGLIAAELGRGTLPGFAAGDDPGKTGYVVLAMGKLGAGELNYSSDIDLIVLFDETKFAPEDHAAARKVFIRVTQRLVKLLSEMTADGYVFRTDLRLRPNPSATPVCIAMDAAEHYYESLGRTWERAAMIKARVAAGDFAAGEAFLDRLSPFVWRRSLDFAAIRDAEDMVLKIRAHKGLKGPISFAGHDMKLGRGGIREIEFFAQTHQLIFGGRDASLRDRRTMASLDGLAQAGRVDRDVAEGLKSALCHHRMIEHRIQMIDDAQTHKIPEDPAKIARLAALCGWDDADRFAASVTGQLEAVHQATDLRKSSDKQADGGRPRSGNAAHTDAEIPAEIAHLVEQHYDVWHGLPALRSARARESFESLTPRLQDRAAKAVDAGRFLDQFGNFLSVQPAGIQLFSLFEANPPLFDLLLDICSTAPEAAHYLASNPSVLESVLDRAFFVPLPELDELQADIQARLRGQDDYETCLDIVRIWKKEAHFRAGVHFLRGLADAPTTGAAFSTIAEACVRALLPVVQDHLSGRFGPPPGRGMSVIAMGKLGSAEMTATSDLDLIVVYDADGVDETSGRRQIASSAYYAKATQTLISALTVPTAEGTLFEVDMRLRPSGKKGPVATGLAAFRDYQKNDAWTWEHLALTRARVIAGPDDLAGDVDAAIAEVRGTRADPARVIADVNEMRVRLNTEKPGSNFWQMKPGLGRMMDCELLIQAGAVISGISDARAARPVLARLAETGWMDARDAADLAEAHALYAAVQQVARYVGAGFDPDSQAEARALVLKVTECADIEALTARLIAVQDRAAEILARHLGAAA